MKPIQTILGLLAIISLMLLLPGCAHYNNMLDKENAAIGAGFKIIKPKKPEQAEILRTLPPDKVTRITYGGKPYYVLPDLANQRAFVGGPKQYQAYLKFRREQTQNAENYQPPVEIVEVVGNGPVGWGDWEGWGTDDGMDGVAEPGWY